MSSRFIYIGAADADARQFETRARADFPGLDLYASNDRDGIFAHLEDAEALIGHHFQFDDRLLRSAPRLRWIQSLTTGTDAILQLAALRAEVTVTSTRGMHGPQMSELVFLQMLALLRNFPRMQRNQSAHRWDRWPQPLLAGKTVVIVGVGAIAEVLAPRCKAFGMTVYGISNSSRRPPGFDEILSRDELPRDAAVLSCMKPSAYLINVARGGVLDEQALLASLREQRIAGAALDVFRERQLPADSPLWSEDRIIITPHIGGMSDVYLDQAYPIVRDNIKLFLAGNLTGMKNIVAH
jgi:D-2-hydroxyacid dehydrogenase (NADP+)